MSVQDRQSRIQRYREGMRARGMRPVQIWVADTRTEAFRHEAQRQSLAANAAEDDGDTIDWLEQVNAFDDPAPG